MLKREVGLLDKRGAVALADLALLQQALGVSFDNLSLLEQAVVHSSYINENPDSAPVSNERLEFLGDAILGLVVAEKLYRDFPHYSEGEMTKLRAALVSRSSLFRMAKAIELGDYLYLGKGEEAGGGRRKPANLAGALEAVIAAIFLAQGWATASDCILRLLAPQLEEIISRSVVTDYKSQLQELIQARHRLTPTYHVVATTGPDHVKEFTVEVRMGGIVLGRGSGENKKAAEADAARSALEQLSTSFTQ